MQSAGTPALQKLRADEAELAVLVSAEQGHRSDLNQQLDTIDQTLRR